MLIKTVNKEVTIATYTRAMARAVNAEMMKGVISTAKGKDLETNIPAMNADNAEELSICLLTGLSLDELGQLTVVEYDALKVEVNKATTGTEKKTEK